MAVDWGRFNKFKWVWPVQEIVKNILNETLKRYAKLYHTDKTFFKEVTFSGG